MDGTLSVKRGSISRITMTCELGLALSKTLTILRTECGVQFTNPVSFSANLPILTRIIKSMQFLEKEIVEIRQLVEIIICKDQYFVFEIISFTHQTCIIGKQSQYNNWTNNRA